MTKKSSLIHASSATHWGTGSFLLFLLVMSLAPLPVDNYLFDAFQNFGHTICYGILAILILNLVSCKNRTRAVPVLRNYATAGCCAACIGILFEILQIPGDRSASFFDLLYDAAGITGFLLVAAVADTRIFAKNRARLFRVAAVLTAILLLIVPLVPAVFLSVSYLYRNNRFPEICGFDSFPENGFVSFTEASGKILKPGGQWRENRSKALRLVFPAKKKNPGFSVTECYPDWRTYSMLCCSVFSMEEKNFTLSIRVHDKGHDNEYQDRFNTAVIITPGFNRVRVPVSKIRHAPRGREMDLSHIKNITCFVVSPEKEIVAWFDDIRLE